MQNLGLGFRKALQLFKVLGPSSRGAMIGLGQKAQSSGQSYVGIFTHSVTALVFTRCLPNTRLKRSTGDFRLGPRAT